MSLEYFKNSLIVIFGLIALGVMDRESCEGKHNQEDC